MVVTYRESTGVCRHLWRDNARTARSQITLEFRAIDIYVLLRFSMANLSDIYIIDMFVLYLPWWPEAVFLIVCDPSMNKLWAT
jgi:hypothetical protein